MKTKKKIAYWKYLRLPKINGAKRKHTITFSVKQKVF